ncbi:type I polyketide synthase [Hyalangium minutum]|uniref:Malonyl CoA-acyl carrier protein transacylase n=1 Tax=Hyalangium minutum TaxID=394096 RepID=A0A085WNP0_9BACT|nr:type I polyketide synthase [Hyalangium minutum]KFE69303.1 Malonyl CoA-acyl carrier protein transacylase [Hyalangium minutum]
MSEANAAEARKALLRQALSKIDELQTKLTQAEQFRDAPIAVVGIGCRFPGANEPERYWRNLAEGLDLVTEVPPDRWDNEQWFDPDPDAPGKTYSRHGGFLGKVDGFDAAFFGIAPRDAVHMDPQHRLLLECAWEALERAGLPADRLSGTKTGVFVGISSSDYGMLIHEREPMESLDAYFLTGLAPNFAAGRTSYVLGLQGPAMAVDTACSSSLVAVHLACQSLRAGGSDLALAAGTNLMLMPLSHIVMSKVRVLSGTGRCRTFDTAADGLVRGEAVAVVVLKRLSDALAAGDNVLAVIRGTAVNQDGPSSGLTVPNKHAQERVIRDALENAKVQPHEVSYVEAHGTGTPLGDPIELRALSAVYGKDRPADSPLYVGSVKTNIGHTEPSAGIAGLIKVILSLQNRTLPPHLHLHQRTPQVDWSGLGIDVPTRLTPWSRPKLIAGVSAFGASGTNAHIVVEEAPPVEHGSPKPVRPELLVLSARGEPALRALATEYISHLQGGKAASMAELAAAASVRRMHHEHRLAVVGETHEELVAALEPLSRGAPHPFGASGQSDKETRRKVVFVFPGQGSQWAAMGRDLLEQEPVFLRAVERCAEAFAPHVDWSLLDELRSEQPSERMDVIQPALFAMEVGLAALWRSWGLEPDAVIGHSMGEVAAAHVAGALSLEDAARVICRRSKLLREVSGQGAMAVVELGMKEAQERLRGLEDRLAVAVSNGPRSTVLSGNADALETLLGQLEREGIFCRRVKVTVASHSPQMDPLRGPLLAALAELKPRQGAVPLYSTVTGEVSPGTSLDPAYWVNNLREPVRFWHTIEKLMADGHTLFVEISPHPILLPAIEQIFAERATAAYAFGSLRREQPARRTLLKSLGDLYVRGAPIDWTKLYPNARVVPLPTYPFQRERYWVDPPAADARRARGASMGGALLGERFESAGDSRLHSWRRWLSLGDAGFLAEHLVQGLPMVPATIYPLLVLEAARRALGPGQYAVEELLFGGPLALEAAPQGERELQISLVEEGAGRTSFRAASRREGEPWAVHVSGRIGSGANMGEVFGQEALEAVRARCSMPAPADGFYGELEQRGIANGPRLRSIQEIWLGQGEALTRLSVPAGSARASEGLPLHPVLLDGAFQSIGAALATLENEEPGVPLPTRIQALTVGTSSVTQAWSHVRVRSIDARTLEADLRILDEAGALIAEARGLRLELRDAGGQRPEAKLFANEWQATEALPAPTSPEPGTWLVVTHELARGRLLGQRLEAHGQKVLYAEPGALRVTDRARVLLSEALAGPCRGVLYLASSVPTPGAEDVAESCSALGRDSMDLLAIAQALQGSGVNPLPRLWLITQGAQSVAGEPVSLAQSGVWGLSRSLFKVKSARLDVGSEDTLESASRELLTGSAEDEIVLRPNARYVARLRQPGAGLAFQQVPAHEQPFRLEVEKPGELDSLSLRVSERRAPGRGEVEFRVHAAGLNFSDAMKALGMYPAEEGEKSVLGLECAGQVIAVGEGVEGLEVGQEVFGLAAGSLGAYVTVPAAQVVARPRGLTVEQAASSGMAFTAAWHALHEVARLQKGERILIHCAASGVGLAAVRIARQVGAEVFATTSSPEKRDFLREQGVARVMDSRSLRFAEEVLAATQGEGVDVVLNSLAGEAIEKGLSVLASDGRFVDLGKRDLNAAHRTLSLGLLRKRISYHVVDLLGLARERPGRIRSLLGQVSQALDQGTLAPLPVHVWPLAKANEAIRALAMAKHVGKLVVSIQQDEGALVSVPARPWAGLSKEAAYLLVTDAPTMGAWLLRWMVEEGARHVVLATPREGTFEALAAGAREAEVAGADVEWARVELTDASQLAHLLEEGERRGRRWKGFFHAPAAEPREALESALGPSVTPAMTLETLTRGRALDTFVLLSSGGASLGRSSPPTVSAMTAVLDALAQRRRLAGLPGLSLDLGPVATEEAQKGAAANLSARQARALLSEALGSGLTQVGALPASPPEAGWMSRVSPLPRFSEVVAALGSTGGASAGAGTLLSGVAPEERKARLLDFVHEQVSLVLRMDREKISVEAPLRGFGIDSLMGLELRNRLEKALGFRLPATVMWSSPTIAALVEKLLEVAESQLVQQTN